MYLLKSLSISCAREPLIRRGASRFSLPLFVTSAGLFELLSSSMCMRSRLSPPSHFVTVSKPFSKTRFGSSPAVSTLQTPHRGTSSSSTPAHLRTVSSLSVLAEVPSSLPSNPLCPRTSVLLSKFPEVGRLIVVLQNRHPKQLRCQKHHPRLITSSPRTMHSPQTQQILKSRTAHQQAWQTIRAEVPRSLGLDP